ncbi:hypothetical protein RvY_10617 [Ramazzottius varieornatus]|uniref:Uncharacterized protein n=1 Tax=Ramazzottius varieornatus TaxID=947166 RepID=A0A1D1VDE3_RAMVA|nr:hypothetical protein RvY_10617 [Ramazzottius varieornatus]
MLTKLVPKKQHLGKGYHHLKEHCRKQAEYCQYWRTNQTKDSGKKERGVRDYELWVQVFGVSELSIVKKVHFRTNTRYILPLRYWLGVEEDSYKMRWGNADRLKIMRQQQNSQSLCTTMKHHGAFHPLL